MSTDELSAGPSGPVPGPAVAPAVLRGPGTWSLTWHGVRTVATLELRQRVKSTRWIITLVIWGAVLAGLTALIRWAVFDLTDPSDRSTAGSTVFGVIVFLVLSLGSLISPALSATSVNGDRTAGVLAIMQSTLLSPAELALGKLLAAWASALALLAVALPFVGWAYVEGGTPIGRLLVVLLVLALTLLVVCAIGLGYSALTARTSTSAVLTYLTVAFLGLGLPLLFALTFTLIQSEEWITVREPVTTSTNATTGEETFRCEQRTERVTQTHTERTWWLLAPSPYVVVADAAPTPSRELDDPLTAIRAGVREARLGAAGTEDWCGDSTSDARARQDEKARENLPAAWPYGLGVDLLLGAGFVVLTVRRLRTPADRLPRGTRVA